VSDLRWDDVREIFIQHGHGTFFRVVDTTASNWQAVLDLVRSRQWRYDYGEDGVAVPMPERATDILDRAADDAFPILWVWPNSVLLAIFEPCCAEEIEFGIDLRQVQGQHRLEALWGFLRTIGQLLERPVLMMRHGDRDTEEADLVYRPEADQFVIVRPSPTDAE
jgi:hypothetical protein